MGRELTPSIPVYAASDIGEYLVQLLQPLHWNDYYTRDLGWPAKAAHNYWILEKSRCVRVFIRPEHF